MINKFNKLFVLAAIMLFAKQNLLAQSKADSSNSEIKVQAIEMRNKINTYLSNQLDDNGNRNNENGIFISDSMANSFMNQGIELEIVKGKLKELESTVDKLNQQVFQSAASSKGAFVNLSTGGNYIQYGEKQLNLYFAFNNYQLSADQQAVLNAFLANKTDKKASVLSYTDWRGAASANRIIGNKRAKSAIPFLKNKVKSYTLKIETQCETIMANDALNAQWCRRIEIILH